MILKELFKMQGELDNHIIEEHNLHGKDLFSNKVVALIVELSECANEIRFFKHWSNKGASHKNIILEEYVDCLHFILSIGNDLNTYMITNHDYILKLSFNDLSEDFIDIIKTIIEISTNYRFYRKCNNYSVKELIECLYIDLVEKFLGLGYKLGFTNKDIEMAYYSKNSINHKRQEQGY